MHSFIRIQSLSYKTVLRQNDFFSADISKFKDFLPQGTSALKIWNTNAVGFIIYNQDNQTKSIVLPPKFVLVAHQWTSRKWKTTCCIIIADKHRSQQIPIWCWHMQLNQLCLVEEGHQMVTKRLYHMCTISKISKMMITSWESKNNHIMDGNENRCTYFIDEQHSAE
jgi:hypothetical protein